MNGHSSSNHNNSPNKPMNGHNSAQQPQNQEELGKQTWISLQKLNAQNTSAEERQIANKFLSQYLPNHPSCWNICAKFLTTDNIPHEAHFFAANMLRNKIQRNLHQVPHTQHLALHNMIEEALRNFNRKDSKYENVRTQLCIALALLAIQRTDWKDEVQTLVKKYGKPETLDILLNILRRLPEELYTFHIPVSPNIKRIAAMNLRTHASLVLKLLHELFGMVENTNSADKINIELKIFKTFAAWLDFMDSHLSEYMEKYSKLTEICFKSLSNDRLFKDACTCISKILRLSDGDTSRYYNNDKQEADEDSDQNTDSLMRRQFDILVPNIVSLRGMYLEAVKQSDKERCYGLTRLFVDTAEHYTDWIIQCSASQHKSKEVCQQLINIILACSAHSDPEISTYVVIFWQRLFHPFISIVKELKKQNGLHKLEAYDEFERKWPIWCQAYVDIEHGLIPRIIPNTVKSAMLPLDFNEMDRDEKDDALYVRWQLADVIGEICIIISLKNVLNILSNMLQQFCLSDHSNNGNEQQNIVQTYQCEAILFCIRSAYKANPDEYSNDHPLCRIFQQISQLSNDIVVQKMAIDLIKVHCTFIDPSSNLNGSKQIFEFLSQYVLCALNEPAIQREAVGAICSFCKKFKASELPSDFVKSLFLIYQNKSNNLHIKDQIILIEAMTILISTFDKMEDCKQGITKLLSKPQQQLTKLLKQQQQNIQNNDNVDNVSLYDTINCISEIFKHFQPEFHGSTDISLGVSLLEAIWNDIEFVLQNYTNRDDIMEKTTRIIKHVIRNGGSRHFMQSSLCIKALKLLTDLYCDKSQRSSFLYIIWIYVDEYIYKNQDAAKELMKTIYKITECTFSILQNNEDSFRQNPDIVEDFYELIHQFLKKAQPELIIQNAGFLKNVFERAMFGLLLDQTKPHEAVCSFYCQCIDFGLYNDQNGTQYEECINALLNQYGNEIILKILQGISGLVRYERADCLADLLNVMYKYDKSKIGQMLQAQIQNIRNVQPTDPSNERFVHVYIDSQSDSKTRTNIAMDWFVSCERYLRSRTF